MEKLTKLRDGEVIWTDCSHFLFLTCPKYSNAVVVTTRILLYSSRYVNFTVVFKVESKACAGRRLFPEKDLDLAK